MITLDFPIIFNKEQFKIQNALNNALHFVIHKKGWRRNRRYKKWINFAVNRSERNKKLK